MTTLPPHHPPILQPIPFFAEGDKDITADVLRLDLLHPVISGNKWFKIKNHFQAAQRSSGTIVTFGGAWSNHLIATACAARDAGLTAIGVVRGEHPPILSPTLASALEHGMQLEFISRGDYAQKTSPAFLHRLASRYPGAYIIPEGGAGEPGITGSEDILRQIDSRDYTHILCAVGTGTMFLGLIRASLPNQTIIGVPVLRGFDLLSTVDPTSLTPEQVSRARLLTTYHFGGYARHPQDLLDFMNDIYRHTGIPTDIVYTGKLFFASRDSIRNDYFPTGARLLIIHSGGLQGNLSLSPGTLQF